jgi:hypothetical protein
MRVQAHPVRQITISGSKPAAEGWVHAAKAPRLARSIADRAIDRRPPQTFLRCFRLGHDLKQRQNRSAAGQGASNSTNNKRRPGHITRAQGRNDHAEPTERGHKPNQRTHCHPQQATAKSNAEGQAKSHAEARRLRCNEGDGAKRPHTTGQPTKRRGRPARAGPAHRLWIWRTRRDQGPVVNQTSPVEHPPSTANTHRRVEHSAYPSRQRQRATEAARKAGLWS